MSDAYWAQHLDIPSPWDTYLDAVEANVGRRITDTHTIDMLYGLYMGDVPAETAADSVGALDHASHAGARVLATLKPEDTMRVDLKPDAVTRFRGHAQAPRAALARRRTGLGAEWRMVGAAMIAAGAISLLVALVLAWRGD